MAAHREWIGWRDQPLPGVRYVARRRFVGHPTAAECL